MQLTIITFEGGGELHSLGFFCLLQRNYYQENKNTYKLLRVSNLKSFSKQLFYQITHETHHIIITVCYNKWTHLW